jgi:hypothetical protein
METLLQISREPKTLELEKTDGGHFRLVITLKKLNMVSKLEYFLDQDEARLLSQALAESLSQTSPQKVQRR